MIIESGKLFVKSRSELAKPVDGSRVGQLLETVRFGGSTLLEANERILFFSLDAFSL